MSACATRPGAAFISAPKDIMIGEANGEVVTATTPVSVVPADEAAIAAAADLINKAKNPVLMLGMLASEKNTASAVQRLIAKTNMSVVCTYQGAGVVPREHFDRFGGRVGLFRTQPADRILDAADLVIAIGYDPVEFEPGLWNRGKKRNLIDVDVTSADIDNNYRPQVELIGNIGATIGALIDHVDAGGPAGSAEILREVAIERAALAEKAAALNGTPIHPIRLVHEIQTLLSSDMTLCLDMGSFHIWLARYLCSFRARQVKALDMQGPVVIGVPVDYSDNHKLMKIMHPG